MTLSTGFDFGEQQRGETYSEQLQELPLLADRLAASRRSAAPAASPSRPTPQDYTRQPELWRRILSEQCTGLFTRRQEEVIAYRLTGKTYAQIGAKLYLSPCTIKGHIESAVVRAQLDHPDQLLAFIAAYLITHR